MTYYEISDNILLKKHTISIEKTKRPDTTAVIVEPISEQFYIVINSFQNKCLLVKKADWDNIEFFPSDFSELLVTPTENNLDVFRKKIVSSASGHKIQEETITFIIAPSYACNLKCSYCYQQYNHNLCKDKISQENLDIIFDVIRTYKQEHPSHRIFIGLFGGEPLLPGNADIIDQIFSFCVDNRLPIHITTNGTYLPEYMKKIVIHRGLNMQINTTVDSFDDNQATRSNVGKSVSERNQAQSILDSIYVLINNKVWVDLSMNIDRHNIENIPSAIEYLRKQSFLTNEYFSLSIGRVDDRLYETNYTDILPETDILQKLSSIADFPSNAHAAFIKTPYNLCQKIGKTFNQLELKGEYSYCWTASSLDRVFYVDSQLDTFRCTFTVGRKEFSTFKFSYENINNYVNTNRTYLDYNDCIKCPIGGFCSGGCTLSASVDFKKQCAYEKSQFSNFLTKFFFPYVRKMLDEQADSA